MLRRLLFYGIYFGVLLVVGYCCSFIPIDYWDYRDVGFLLLSFLLLYYFSDVFVRAGMWLRVAITVIIWSIAAYIGIKLLVGYAVVSLFGVAPSYVGLRVLGVFCGTIIVCQEIYRPFGHWISRRLAKRRD
jgi:hypothetical protein